MKIPEDAIQFSDQFATEDGCLDFIEEVRWPHGFVCPNCQHNDGYHLHTRKLIQCVLCRHQSSVTAGTIFHKTKVPLRAWFYIIFSMAHDKGGASSTRLARELGMNQNTVWHIMHKLRRAMGARDQSITLAGFIEMDEAVLGPHARRPKQDKKARSEDEDRDLPKKPPRGGRGRKSKAGTKRKKQVDVLVLVEQERSHAGYIAMKVLEATAANDLNEVLNARVDEGSHIKTDGFHAHHTALRSFNCTYKAVVCSGPDGCIELPIVHRVINLLKHFLMGTYFGVSRTHLQLYLNEFCFRFIRRESDRPLWLSVLRAGIFSPPWQNAELTT